MKKFQLFVLALMALFTTSVWADTYYIICNKANVPLTLGMNNAKVQLLKVEGTTVSATTDISITTTASEGLYYNSTSTTFSNLTKTSNYGTSSGSSRTMSGFKVGDGKSLTIKLGSTIPFSQLDVIYSCGSSDAKKINIAGTEYSTNDKQIHLATITSNVTGNIEISNNSGKDYYVFAILTVPAQKYTVTYTAGAGTGENVVDDEATTVADCPNTFSKEGYKFIGWKDSEDNDVSVGAAVTSNLTLTAQWAQLYSVTYNANGATGTVPTEDEHIAGEKFNIAAQGSIVTPENKAFAGWTYGNGVYAAGAEFTMPEANVEFVAKWIDTYSVTYKANGGIGDDIVANNPATIAACTFTAPEGKVFNGWKDGNGTRYEVGAAVSTTLVLFAQWKNAPITLFSMEASDNSTLNTVPAGSTLNLTTANELSSLTGGTAEYKNNNTDAKAVRSKQGNLYYFMLEKTGSYVAPTLTSPNVLQVGDTIYASVYGGKDNRGVYFATTVDGANTYNIQTGDSEASNTEMKNLYYVIDEDDDLVGKSTIYIMRYTGNGTYFRNFRIIRPGAKSAVSTVVSISAVTVNDEAISVSDLAKLNADPYTVALTSEYGTAPTIKFTKHTVITYDDDSESSSDAVETVSATEEEGKWQAQLTIDEITYTVTTVKVAASTDATLSSIKIGTDALEGFDAATEVYNIGEFGVYETFTVSATTNDANATKVITADETNKKVTIEVTAEDGTTTKTYTLNYTREAATELVAISGSTTWDWSKAGSATAEQKAGTMPTNVEEFNFADVLINPNESFNAAALAGIAQFANRGTYFQGTQAKFQTTVAGKIEVYYQNTSNREESGRRWVVVNGTKVGDGAIDQNNWYKAEADVNAGEIVITFIDKNDAATMLRINKLVFTAKYAVNCADAENGSLIADKSLAAAGETVTLTITPAEGYELNVLTVKDAMDADVTVTDGKFTMPASNVTITATFKQEGGGTSINNTSDAEKAQKRIENGQLVIEKNGQVFNAMGQTIR